MSSRDLVLVPITAAVFAGIGLLALISPNLVRDWARRSILSGKAFGSVRLLRYIESREYIMVVRTSGVIAIAMAALLIFFFRRLLG
jgi:hypothetical protein